MEMMSKAKRRGPLPGPAPLDHYMPDTYGESAAVTKMLEAGPLYRKFRYECRGPVRLPDEVRLFCESPKCGGERLFRLQKGSSLNYVRYNCSNCSQVSYEFLLNWKRSYE